jgi:hypothetical protein
MEARRVMDAHGREWVCQFRAGVGVCRLAANPESPQVILPARLDWATLPDARIAQEIIIAEADQGRTPRAAH